MTSLGSSRSTGGPIVLPDQKRPVVTSDTFTNKPGLIIPAETSITQVILDAELPQGVSKLCTIEMYLDGYDNLASAGGYTPSYCLEISWGVGGLNRSTRFTISRTGRYHMSVAGNWFRVSVVNYADNGLPPDPQATISAGISTGTVDNELGLHVGEFSPLGAILYHTIDLGNTPSPVYRAGQLCIGDGMFWGLGLGGIPIFTIGGVATLQGAFNLIPRYARAIRFVPTMPTPFEVWPMGVKCAINEQCPWLPINGSLMQTTYRPVILEVAVQGQNAPIFQTFVRF